MPIGEVKKKYPSLYSYLQEGIQDGVSERYLCKNRKIWYAQENRAESTFYCTYMGRSDKNGKNPFRVILNHSKAIVANSYLILYPKPKLQKVIDADFTFKTKLNKALNKLTGEAMLNEGRVYGGGMHKIEPKELANVSALEISRLL